MLPDRTTLHKSLYQLQGLPRCNIINRCGLAGRSPKSFLSTLLVFCVVLISACSVEDDVAEKNPNPADNASFVFPQALQINALPATCSGSLEAYLIIDQNVEERKQMTIRAEDGKAVYKISELELGEHEFTIEFSCRTTELLLLASATITQDIIDGPNRIAFANNDYLPLPDLDGDNVSNLRELLSETDPFTPPASADTTAPSAPNLLRSRNTTTASTELTWVLASDPESGVTNYRIYRDNNFVGEAAAPPYQDQGLAADTLYVYTVRAVNGAGIVGADSAEIQVTTQRIIDATPPTAPGLPQPGEITTQSIALSWSPASDTESGIASYKVYRNGNVVGTPTTASYVDRGLADTTAYSYQVAALNGESIEGPKSAVRQIITRTPVDTSPPSAPGTPQADTITPTGIDISWGPATDLQSGIVEYKVFRDDVEVSTETVNTTSFTDSGLTPSTAYTYQVLAVNGVSLPGPRSNAAILSTIDEPDTTPPDEPGDPTVVEITTQSIEITWTAAQDVQSGVATYQVYRDNQALASVIGTTFLDDAVTPATEYIYQVSAINTLAMEGLRSAEVSISTPAEPDVTPPTAPGEPLQAANITTQGVEISWTPASDAESGIVGYQVYRNNMPLLTVPIAGSPYVDSGLTALTTYSYQVSAINGEGLSGPRTAALDVTTLTGVDDSPPTAPGLPTASNVTTQSIELTWSLSTDPESTIVDYQVYRDAALVATVPAPPYVDTGLAEATAYTYTVLAVSDVPLESLLSAPASLSTATDNTPPDLLSTTTGTDPTVVTVVFSEPVDSLSATTVGNYVITPAITVANASLSADSTTVTLTTGALLAGITYNLAVSNILDTATTANSIAANSNLDFSYLISAPSRAGYQWDILALNNPVYTDTNYVYDAIPPQLVGLSSMRTTDADKTIAAAQFVDFTVSQGVIVYVAYDINSPLPAWLDTSWVDSGLLVTAEEGDIVTFDFKLYTKSFPAGTVSLANSGDALLMYTVFVAPDPNATILNINSVSNPTPSPAPVTNVVGNDSDEADSDSGSLIIFGIP